MSQKRKQYRAEFKAKVGPSGVEGDRDQGRVGGALPA